MNYEVMANRRRTTTGGGVYVTVRQRGIFLSSRLIQAWLQRTKKSQSVLLLWDESARKIRMDIADENDSRAYTVTIGRSAGQLSAIAFLKSIGRDQAVSVRCPAQIVDGGIEFHVPEQNGGAV